jgi:hypothetical protein
MSFKDMTPERRKAVSSLGGKSVEPHMRGFYRNRELASKAAIKGAQMRKEKQNANSGKA